MWSAEDEAVFDATDVEWMVDAACTKRADLGWINDPEQVGLDEEVAMMEVCASCPVQTTCETYVDQVGITAGFWAGYHRTPEGALLPLTGDAA